jgi:hypothetical protein
MKRMFSSIEDGVRITNFSQRLIIFKEITFFVQILRPVAELVKWF